MSEVTKKKLVRSTAAQIKVLVDYMSTNPNFAAGDFSGPLGAKKMEAEWQTLKSILMEHGPDKSVEHWKQTWKDLKKKARHENAAVSRAQSQTGNSTAVPIVSETLVKVLDTIGRESSVGIGPPESPIGVFVEPMHLTMDDVEVCTSTATASIPTATASYPRQRSRMRNNHASEFANLQKENNDILKVVVELLKEKNNLLQEQNSILRERNRIMKRKFQRK